MQGYPGITPFEGMASGVAALVRHLPAGSSAIFYCIHGLIEKANLLCRSDLNQHPDMWRNWQGESEPCKKLLELLLRLISLVDIQVIFFPHMISGSLFPMLFFSWLCCLLLFFFPLVLQLLHLPNFFVGI